MRKGATSRRAKVFLILGSILVSLFIAEIGLRILGYSYPNFYTTDWDRGVALRPGVKGWYRKEGEAYVEINSDGLRDREHSKAKPPQTVRIAVVGDSFAEALQVPMEDAFWMVMERKLKDCPAFAGKEIEAINFGVSGYGTAQELITLRKHVWEYAPDIVLLAVTTNNDITDNSRALKKTDEIPYFTYRDGQLALDNSFRESKSFRVRQSLLSRAGRWISDHVRVIQAIDQAQRAFKIYLSSRKTNSGAAKQPVAGGLITTVQAQTTNPQNTSRYEELGIDNLIYQEPEDQVWRDAWRVTEGLITEMSHEVHDQGAKFLVVTLSSGIQVHPEPALRQAFMRKVGATDLFYPDRRIKALGDREGFAVLNLAPTLQQYAEQHQVYLHGFGKEIGNGHWNRLGHRLAGEIIAAKLCDGMAR